MLAGETITVSMWLDSCPGRGSGAFGNLAKVSKVGWGPILLLARKGWEGGRGAAEREFGVMLQQPAGAGACVQAIPTG